MDIDKGYLSVVSCQPLYFFSVFISSFHPSLSLYPSIPPHLHTTPTHTHLELYSRPLINTTRNPSVSLSVCLRLSSLCHPRPPPAHAFVLHLLRPTLSSSSLLSRCRLSCSVEEFLSRPPLFPNSSSIWFACVYIPGALFTSIHRYRQL